MAGIFLAFHSSSVDALWKAKAPNFSHAKPSASGNGRHSFAFHFAQVQFPFHEKQELPNFPLTLSVESGKS
jgi:hypothetical protein